MDPRSGKPEHPQGRGGSSPSKRARTRRIRARQDALFALWTAPPDDEDALFGLIADIAEDVTGSRAAFLVEVEDESRVTRRGFSKRTLKACKVSDHLQDAGIPGRALWAECLQTRGPVFRNAVEAQGPEGHIPLSRALYVPVLDRGQVVAVCGVANKPAPYTKADADHLALFLEAAWTCVVRKRLESALREREAMFSALAEQSIAGIGLIGSEGFVFANQALERLAGYTLQEIRNLGPLGFAQGIHPEDRDLVLRRHLARMAGEPGLPDTYDFRLLRPDGGVRWVTMAAARVEVAGRPHVAVTVVDSHDRHVADELRKETLVQVRRTLDATVLTLSRAIEVRDPYTAGHQRRVADLARAIATEMDLDASRVEAVRMAGVLHDIGKVGVPAEILAKPGKLGPSEMDLIRTHSQVGCDILTPVQFPWPIHLYVLQHHERLDGSGYPQGLRGDAILPESRILAVADVVEAMASHRPYRPAFEMAVVLRTIEEEQAKSFDPDVVRACLTLFREKGYRLG